MRGALNQLRPAANKTNWCNKTKCKCHIMNARYVIFWRYRQLIILGLWPVAVSIVVVRVWKDRQQYVGVVDGIVCACYCLGSRCGGCCLVWCLVTDVQTCSCTKCVRSKRGSCDCSVLQFLCLEKHVSRWINVWNSKSIICMISSS